MIPFPVHTIVKKALFCFFIPVFLHCSTGCSRKDTSSGSADNDCGKLGFHSPDSELNKVFAWAEKQALSYAFTGDPVGLWYEAALPGREAFCMRDISHQAMGAHFLGLAPYTANMLYRFAENISGSRDWCSYWEINRYGDPALVDYLNDDAFWYNLPANFDILDCCYRMYTWTGDRRYIHDPVFLNFYRKTVYDYVERWDLGPAKIMTRPRIMNSRGEAGRKFTKSRGIPGYNEGDPDYTVGIDLVVCEYKAFLAYARIQQLRGNDPEADKFLGKAEELLDLLDHRWWDTERRQFHTHLNKAHEPDSRGTDRSVLYRKAARDTFKLRSALKRLIHNLPQGPVRSIEFQSHLPEILYYYNENDEAYRQLLYLYRNERREYPEASFSAIGAFVSGLMGVELEIFPPGDALVRGGYVDRVITTLPRLNGHTAWAGIEHIPVWANDIGVRHEGVEKTTFINHKGPALIWKVRFPGSFAKLELNGRLEDAVTEELIDGRKVSWIRVVVGAGETITVRVPGEHDKKE